MVISIAKASLVLTGKYKFKAITMNAHPSMSGKRQEDCTGEVLTSTPYVTEAPQSASRHDLTPASDQ